MRVAIVTFERFNEIDSFVAYSILNRLKDRGVRARICAPTPKLQSMNGITIEAEEGLEYANEADAVLIGSGRGTAAAIADAELMTRFELDPSRQWIGSQCSGALVLAKLGILNDQPACTDLMTAPVLEAAGVRVLDRSFHSEGRVATAGGCLASQYLAAWVLRRELGEEAVREALRFVAPVGEVEATIERALAATA